MSKIDWDKVRGVYPVYDDRIVMFIMEYGREVGMRIPENLDFFGTYDEIKSKVHKVKVVPYKQVSEAMKGSNGRPVKVMCVESGTIYKSGADLCKALGFKLCYRAELMRRIRKRRDINGKYYEILEGR